MCRGRSGRVVARGPNEDRGLRRARAPKVPGQSARRLPRIIERPAPLFRDGDGWCSPDRITKKLAERCKNVMSSARIRATWRWSHALWRYIFTSRSAHVSARERSPFILRFLFQFRLRSRPPDSTVSSVPLAIPGSAFFH
jgi:hypothetical protein